MWSFSQPPLELRNAASDTRTLPRRVVIQAVQALETGQTHVAPSGTALSPGGVDRRMTKRGLATVSSPLETDGRTELLKLLERDGRPRFIHRSLQGWRCTSSREKASSRM